MSTEARRRANQRYYEAHRCKVLAQRRERRKRDGDYIRALVRKCRQEKRDAYLACRREYRQRLQFSNDPHHVQLKQRMLDGKRRYYWKYQEAISERRAEKRNAYRSLDFEWQGTPLSYGLEYSALSFLNQDSQTEEFINLLSQTLTPEQVNFLDTLMDCDFDMNAVANSLNTTIATCNETMAAIRQIALTIKETI